MRLDMSPVEKKLARHETGGRYFLEDAPPDQANEKLGRGVARLGGREPHFDAAEGASFHVMACTLQGKPYLSLVVARPKAAPRRSESAGGSGLFEAAHKTTRLSWILQRLSVAYLSLVGRPVLLEFICGFLHLFRVPVDS